MSDFNIDDFCKNTSGLLGFVGWVVTIIKIAIPFLIIIFGVLDFGKAVTGGDDKTIKSSLKTVGIRIVAGLVIFFIPSIVVWIFSLVSDYNTAKESGSFEKCETCILRPWNCDK